MSDLIGGVLILSGAVFGLLAGIGQVRFADLFTRMHMATKPATLGLGLVAIGAMFRIDARLAVPLLVLSIILQFVTAPVSAQPGRPRCAPPGRLGPRSCRGRPPGRRR